ncbi:MAG: alcohol dehydrogenase catalytic domain-containing protein [Rhodospirillaceae bacterium]|nr:alcohol dehydrogenase catalytic domain-containing protein [Rhodospirillaceae bacterium]
MKVARFHAPGDLRVEDAPEPSVGPLDVAIRPLAVGVCGTDTHILHGDFPAVPGTVLGHEIAGEIVAVGDAVDYLRKGELVTVEPHVYCTRCHFCRIGAEHMCLDKKAFGVHLDGGLATRLVVPARCAYVVPADTPPEIVAMTEPLACCVHGMDRLDPRQGETMLIIGAGPAGLLLTRLAVLRGVGLLVVSDLDAGRRRAAAAFGAHHVIDPRDPATEQRLLDLTGGLGFETVVDAVGGTETFEFAIARAARRGRVLVFGVAPQAARATVRPYEIFAKELSILGTAINPYTHERAVRLLPRMELARMPTQKFRLEDVHDALAAQESGRDGKMIVCPNG